MFFFLSLIAAFTPPLGSLPETWDRYKKAMNFEKMTFRCFTDGKEIRISQINDNYLDCDDGSDEPGTSLVPDGYFYCQNNGSTPKIINSWSVGDGICDCCDGSDEIFNERIKCLNTCGPGNENIRNGDQNKNNVFHANQNSIRSHKLKVNLDRMNFLAQRKEKSVFEIFLTSLWKSF